MANYQTIEALRPILHRGPPQMPVVDRMLIYKPPTLRSPNADQIRLIQQKRAQGVSIPKVAALTGFCQATVRRYSRHVPVPAGGWQDGSRQSKLEAQRAKIERMRRAGFTWVELAQECGCAESTVRRFLSTKRSARSKRTVLSDIVRAVRVITRIPACDLRQSCRGGPSVARDIAKARHIIFWIAHRRAEIPQPQIAERLGGFAIKTVRVGITNADFVANRLPIPDDVPFGRIAGLMWRAEWPKASV